MSASLAGLSRDTLSAYLAQAQQALVALMTGAQPVMVSYAQGNGSRTVTRRLSTPAEARMLIGEIQAALGIGAARRRPVRFIW